MTAPARRPARRAARRSAPLRTPLLRVLLRLPDHLLEAPPGAEPKPRRVARRAGEWLARMVGEGLGFRVF